MASPFQQAMQTAYNIAGASSGAFQKRQDADAVQKILQRAKYSDTPTNYYDAMAEILSKVSPENQQNPLALLQNMQATTKENQQKQKEREALTKEGLDPDLPSAYQVPKIKAREEAKIKSEKRQQNEAMLRTMEKERGLAPGDLQAFVDNPSLAQTFSKPKAEPKKTQASQPIDPEQLENIKKVRSIPGYNDLDEFEKYKLLTENNVSKENAEAEAKLAATVLDRESKRFDTAYEKQKDFIDKTTSSYRAFETDTKPKLMQMQQIASDNDLINPTTNVFLETLGIPLGALENPHSELYNKLSLDLLKGLPETYGNRILKVEVENFLQTIPSLMNSADGRRMIASNMLKLGEMKEIFYNEMRNQQKSYIDQNKPLPPDFEQRVFDQVRPQIDKTNSEFAKMASVTKVPEGTIPVFTPRGDIKFIPKNEIDRVVKGGAKRIW